MSEQTTGPVATCERLISDLREKSQNAALRNKPTMWAYYGDMADGLARWFADAERTDGAYAGAALALSQRAERECPTLPRGQAAHLWALSVYARRILVAWGAGSGGRVNLDWLRRRANQPPDGAGRVLAAVGEV